ncbi:hypothetical protein QJS10_CPA08g00197 [Acorus calamus]|uniref:Uncharacterized protein n=1 Tax=Acorus calamus TaxID=4465 RepID=A0AAV9EDY5_ACOCL|nr:hypothetical protein QJS10_CPA08g00197 [Acorus calamus]
MWRNAIVQIAAEYVRRLERSKSELQRRNNELMTMLREQNERVEMAERGSTETNWRLQSTSKPRCG